MRFLVTATGPTLDAEVAPSIHGCQYFLLIDTERMEFTPHDNARAPSTETWAVQVIASTGARVVLTGDCGSKARRAMPSAGIDVVTGISGSVRDSVHGHLAGRLRASLSLGAANSPRPGGARHEGSMCEFCIAGETPEGGGGVRAGTTLEESAYEYRCNTCGHMFELSSSDESGTEERICPNCGNRDLIRGLPIPCQLERKVS